jgi:SAM-dependent methyltransferase
MAELEDLKGELGGVCPVCAASEFTYREVLWPELIAEWQLSAAEAKYINLQQGFQCQSCEANLRAMTLAHALNRFRRWPRSLLEWVASEDAQAVKLLEINEAFNLGRHWQDLPGRQLVRYPETDMHALPFADGTFDIVVHSDTLEHVENPVHALGECRRVLKPDGALGFTVPIVVGRLTRSRSGLPASYHGREGDHLEDYRVASEFGADVWTAVFEAGFKRCTLISLIYPASVAILAER